MARRDILQCRASLAANGVYRKSRRCRQLQKATRLTQGRPPVRPAASRFPNWAKIAAFPSIGRYWPVSESGGLIQNEQF
jgi:hypothetical protein